MPPLARWVLLAGLVAACTPLGLIRGDYWTGVSSGGLETCVPFRFDLEIEEGSRIIGSATSEHPWGAVLWQVRGMVAPDRRVALETRTEDPRVPQPRLRWTGTYNPVLWEITQATDASCPAPRTARLQKP